ncbi:MAG: methionyl-tRNA formyltransferase [Candidatus Cloacimonetes bacterium]|jgi:methionyl-tRNA formyltransferase|nr:methionyl-tRNA formyltransferase [Candidatus Cloacimonadota bacterium]MDD2505805.1 methionyl-tRNA formyltransferase [Candidatus Cloacimonadota bacterium]MDD4147614.1 methionyl-tRNA formyltransferase [Candidatus Cloacimonadota bacterium]MDD4559227.1 methionyl-tRNA formyltransferase [Candidatus Cloacimonadota bacterium]
MKIIFAGSSDFAIPALEEIASSKEHKIVLAVSQPAKPKGRKQVIEDTPLARTAQKLGIPLFCPENINEPDSIRRLQESGAEMLVTASYGAFLGRTVRNLCPFGAINLHPSLLPKHRGPSPVRAAILVGDTLTGNTIFRLAAKMDAGAILMQQELKIMPNEDHGNLEQRLALLAAKMLSDYLNNPDRYTPKEQDHARSTYSNLLAKEDLRLDFSQPAEQIMRRVRAYAPDPGAYIVFKGRMLKILQAEISANTHDASPGQITGIVHNKGFCLSTADDELLILRVQAAGKKQMDAWAYHLGARLKIGERIE